MSSLLNIFRALADPTRMRIVHLLRAMELSVGEIAQVVAQSQPRVSRHIRILVEAELVERRKEGNWVFLRLGGAALSPNLIGLFDDIAPDESESLWLKADLARLAAVRADRTRAADEYFARHADDWDAIRSLYVSEAEVEAAMRALVQRHVDGAGYGAMLDIGTGTGRMVEMFGAQASHVTAIDRSPDMLRLARSKLPAADEAGFSAGKYDLLLADFSELPLDPASTDFVTIHQVLHYAQDPAQLMGEVARVLRVGGHVLIADFAPHEREELRTRDQHVRLGFSDDQIAAWFHAAGLEMEAVETLAGGELTVKLWLGKRVGAQVVPIKGKQEQ